MRVRPPTPGPRIPDTNLPATQAVPGVLHLGSGKRFRAEWLNLDVDPTWSPDLVADLEQPFPGGQRQFETERFGAVELRPGMFDRIVAHDVLEHIRNLTTCMTSCRDLLRVGGVFEISVPYDLSHGAWQDPTHVRAFNERSWLYYGDWCWYLGWDDHYLRTARLDMKLSPVGQQLIERGVPQDEVLRTPRAVDAMDVELVKEPVPQAVRAAGAAHHARG